MLFVFQLCFIYSCVIFLFEVTAFFLLCHKSRMLVTDEVNKHINKWWVLLAELLNCVSQMPYFSSDCIIIIQNENVKKVVRRRLFWNNVCCSVSLPMFIQLQAFVQTAVVEICIRFCHFICWNLWLLVIFIERTQCTGVYVNQSRSSFICLCQDLVAAQ